MAWLVWVAFLLPRRVVHEDPPSSMPMETASLQNGVKAAAAAYIMTLFRPRSGRSLVHWSHICGSCKAEIKAATKANSQTVLGSLLYLFTWLSWIRSLIETIICGSHRYIIPDSQETVLITIKTQRTIGQAGN
ncbi:uncharacterized protein LOC122081546 isoform X2 [Macadamia integrifolia]|uniref:uncharacterized protein LOC122081546 isoform X2 n=1 Tax=Macadamia integrifolia TaxID=60698 RepID=UPI001C501D66|nr:uncharacterized protein LOC122081546 isoform X2 [Macadamia integrifolia]